MYLNVVVVVVVVVDDALGFLVLGLLMVDVIRVVGRHAVAGVVRDPSHGVVARVLTATTTRLRPSTSRMRNKKNTRKTRLAKAGKI